MSLMFQCMDKCKQTYSFEEILVHKEKNMCRKGYVNTRPSLPGEKDCGRQILRDMGYDASLLKPVKEGGDPDLAAVLISSA